MKWVMAIVLMSAGAAQAAEIRGKSAIDSVVVYPDGASVVRIMKVNVAAGDNVVTAEDFPLGMDQASLRVEAEADGKLMIGAIEARIPHPEEAPKLDLAKIEALQDQRAGLDNVIRAANLRLQFVTHFATDIPTGLGEKAEARPLSEWKTAFAAVEEEGKAIEDEVLEVKVKQRAIDRQIAALNIREAADPARKLEVRIDVSAPNPTAATFKVSYTVRDARWRPVYDARLEVGGGDRKPALDLVRRAEVIQRSGESWNDVALSVSTLRVTKGGSARDLSSLMVKYQVPAGAMLAVPMRAPSPAAPPGLMMGQDASSLTQLQQGAAVSVSNAATLAKPMMAAPPIEAELATGGYQATYKIAGKVSVPSNEGAKNFRIGSSAIAPDLLVRATPKFDDSAFLEADFKQAEEAPLLPGEVVLFRDGVYVGKGHLALAAKGEDVRLGFGADEKVKVSRVALRKTETAPGGGIKGYLSSSKTDEQAFKITVRNGHDVPIKVRIEDQLPVSEDEDLQVEMLASTTPPTDQNVRDRRGVVAWDFAVEAGKSARDIMFGWRVTWPKDKAIFYN